MKITKFDTWFASGIGAVVLVTSIGLALIWYNAVQDMTVDTKEVKVKKDDLPTDPLFELRKLITEKRPVVQTNEPRFTPQAGDKNIAIHFMRFSQMNTPWVVKSDPKLTNDQWASIREIYEDTLKYIDTFKKEMLDVEMAAARDKTLVSKHAATHKDLSKLTQSAQMRGVSGFQRWSRENGNSFIEIDPGKYPRYYSLRNSINEAWRCAFYEYAAILAETDPSYLMTKMEFAMKRKEGHR